ncbi:serine hydrolase [Nocardia rhamnosiphila]|uniref:serine hydrolase n=1 Tax=Nocardia rhamnosiphila TaxID=426716 RepID=UPI0004C31CD0|nr:serine hydrolase [Nocardia rhamnosiphila]
MRRRRLVVLCVSVVTAAGLVSGCGDREPTPVPGAAAPSTSPSDLRPDQAAGVAIPRGRVDHILGMLEYRAEELMRDTDIPGMAVAVVYDGEVVFQKGFGVRDVDGRQPVKPETVFQLASLSKPVGATVVARQVQEGVVQWDRPVREPAPWFALQDPYVSDHVTIGDLYAHRSGLPEHAGDKLEDLGFDRTAILQRLRMLPLAPFRDSYAYTNFGLTAAAIAVADASKQRWSALSEQAIYRPLGMSSTSSRYADFVAAGDHASGHVLVDGKYRPAQPGRQPDAQSPAGGVSSSVTDMAQWMMMVLANGKHGGAQVVAPEALLPALTPQSVSSPPAEVDARAGQYGFGFNVGNSPAGRVVLSHSGAFDQGAATAMTMIPSANVGIVTLTNAAPIGVPETLNAEFADLVQFGEVRQNWWELYSKAFEQLNAPVGELVGAPPPPNPAPARPLEDYAGEYGNDYFGPAAVAVDGDALLLTMGPRHVAMPLRHRDGDTFVFSPVGESANPGSVSQARFDGDRLWLEFYDSDGCGTFVR